MSQGPPPRRGTVFTPVVPTPAQGASEADLRARTVVERMLSTDAFSQWLGVTLLDVGAGRATVQMTVRPEMVNGFGTAHGGIVFALGDSALAYCTNSTGEISVALDCSVNYPAAVRPGDVLTATGVQETTTRKIGFASVTVWNQANAIVGHFRGTVYRTGKQLFPEGS